MQLKALVCPNCNGEIKANITPEMKTCFCNYCGAQIEIVDENTKTINFNHTFRKIDEAKIHEADVNEKIKFRELDVKQIENKKRRIFIIAIVFVIFILSIAFVNIFRNSGKDYSDEAEVITTISMPLSASHYKGEDYLKTAQALRDLGFVNVHTVPMNDLTFGIFAKEDTVDRVSINGDSAFVVGKSFEKSAKVEIYYHSKK